MKISTWLVASIAVMFLVFQGMEAQAYEEFSTLDPKCSEGNGEACFKIAEKFRILDKDNKKALTYYEKACDNDYKTGCNNAGAILLKMGRHSSKEWKKAGNHFKKACEQKFHLACYNLGQLKFKEGREKRAAKYWKQACDLGNRAGCVNHQKFLNKQK
ncbi:MAG: tetratricopeptide repeat protein [Nitrospinales bacterium]